MNTVNARPQILSYRYKLLPTRAQHRALERILEDQRQLYNAALEERIECYRKTGKGRSYYDQCAALTECRAALPDMAAIPLTVQRWTIKSLDDAYEAFFRRVKSGASQAGFPGFKDRRWFNCFGFREFRAVALRSRRIKFKGMTGSLRIHMHRPLPDGKLLACQVKRGVKGWSVTLQVRVGVVQTRPINRMIGIDLGLDTLAMRSDSTAVANLRIGRRAQRKLRIRQRALRRCKKGSMRRRKIRRGFTRLHAKIGNARQTYLHQQSAKLVKEYDLIAIEALNVKGLARGDLARSVHDVAWGTFIAMLRYKAARDGAQLIEVDPAYTSQTCPECGAVAKKPLEQRWHSCPCGCELDRDVAAARVILNKAVVGLGWPKVTQWGELATGNLAANGKTLPPALSPLLKPESDSVTPP